MANHPTRPKQSLQIRPTATQDGSLPLKWHEDDGRKADGLLFMNFSNPAEIKEKNNKQIVRKFVMRQYVKKAKRGDFSCPDQPHSSGRETRDELVDPILYSASKPFDEHDQYETGQMEILRRSEESNEQSQSMTSMTGTHSPNPVDLLSAFGIDPFDALPIKPGALGHHLLRYCKCFPTIEFIDV